MRLALPLLAFALIVLAAYVPSDASASSTAPPPDWENLQILPDSLTQDELRGIMNGFTEALGVKCSFCHVWTETGPDFPSDAKPQKDVARGMMRMTWQINTEILPAIDGLGHHGPPQVTCNTCHRGSPMPGMDMDHEGMDHEGMEHHDDGAAHEHGDDHDNR